MANNPNATANLKPFTKGDPRIWRGGRPKTFTALQELAQQVAHETAKMRKDGVDIPVVVDGHSVTVAEMILRQWAQSKNPALQMRFIEVAYGKVPDKHELTGADGGPIQTQTVFDHEATVATIARRSGGNRGESGED